MNLNAKHIEAASMIASGVAKQDVAQAVGVTPQTISEWCKNPAFDSLVKNLKWEIINQARERMRGLSTDAVKALEELLQADTKESVRLRACEIILKHTGFTDPTTGLWGWGID